MAAPYSVATIINIGKISCGLARKEAANQRFYNGESLDKNLHRLIAMETDIIDYRYQTNPADVTLLESGWYLYALCGRFINEALKIIGNGVGGGIIDPTTNQPYNLLGVTKMFTVGDLSTAPLMNAGDGGFTVNDTGVVFDTVAFGYTGSSPFPRTGTVPADQVTYQVTYTANGITIQFVSTKTAQDGEQYALTYLRSGTGTSFVPPAGSGLPPMTGHEGEVLFTGGTTAYWRYPCTKITSANFDQTDGVTCANSDWEHNSLIIVWDDLPIVLQPGIHYELISSGGFRILTSGLPGFNAAANSYNMSVWLTGKNQVV